MLKESGVVETGGCSDIARLEKSCSHAAAILWKIFINLNIYFSLSMACRAQGTGMFVKVVDVLHKKFLKKKKKKLQFSGIVVAANNGTCCTWAHFKNNVAFMT